MSEHCDILVISDTHWIKSNIKKVIEEHKEVDKIVHLGDLYEDALYLKDLTDKEVYTVKGNGDYNYVLDENLELVVYGHKIVMTHGHKHHVKESLTRLALFAGERGAAAMLFGHTHIPYCEYDEGIWFINPGSLGIPPNGRCSYAILRVSKIGIIPKIFYLPS